MSGKFCNFCGNSLTADATFCTNCGKSYAQPSPNAQPVQPQPIQTQNPSQASSTPGYTQPAQYQHATTASPSPVYSQPASNQYYQQVPNNFQNNNTDYLKQPMTIGQYIITFIVMGIPLIGVIMMFVWAFGSNVNINKKNYCRAILIMGLIGIVLWIALAAVLVPIMMTLVDELAGSGMY